ncbi:MAG: DUF72 domain-containing protein [Candidatus Nezhaarchaeales archaeon]
MKENNCGSSLIHEFKVYVGTSGWLYDWNVDGSFDWYVSYSELNAVELNASFYRFPFPSQVSSWAKKGSKLKWAIKVNRLITHVKRLKEDSLNIWMRFRTLLKPMDHLVDFYLFQLPPNFKRTSENVRRLKTYAEETDLGSRFAVEFRDVSWFNDETVDVCEKLGITVVSIDAPIGTWIARSSDAICLRMHGRDIWYAYDYEENELRELAVRVLMLKPKRVYVFFNNDHWMLDDARAMLHILKATPNHHLQDLTYNAHF